MGLFTSYTWIGWVSPGSVKVVVAREAHPLSHAKVPHIRGLGYGLTLLGLTFWGCELNVILLAEGGWEDGMGGGVVAEPIGAICGGPPIHTDHQVTIQEHLEGASKMAQRVKTAQHDRCLIPRTYTVEGHTSYHKTLLTSMHIKMNECN